MNTEKMTRKELIISSMAVALSAVSLYSAIFEEHKNRAPEISTPKSFIDCPHRLSHLSTCAVSADRETYYFTPNGKEYLSERGMSDTEIENFNGTGHGARIEFLAHLHTKGFTSDLAHELEGMSPYDNEKDFVRAAEWSQRVFQGAVPLSYINKLPLRERFSAEDVIWKYQYGKK